MLFAHGDVLYRGGIKDRTLSLHVCFRAASHPSRSLVKIAICSCLPNLATLCRIVLPGINHLHTLLSGTFLLNPTASFISTHRVTKRGRGRERASVVSDFHSSLNCNLPTPSPSPIYLSLHTLKRLSSATIFRIKRLRKSAAFLHKSSTMRCKQKTYAAHRVLPWLKSASNESLQPVFYSV
jgi:hypothetical protein